MSSNPSNIDLEGQHVKSVAADGSGFEFVGCGNKGIYSFEQPHRLRVWSSLRNIEIPLVLSNVEILALKDAIEAALVEAGR